MGKSDLMRMEGVGGRRHRVFPSLCRVSVAVVMTVGLWSTARGDDTESVRKISPRELTRRVGQAGLDFHYGGWTVAPGGVVTGALAVAAGSLDIQAGAVVEGEVWVVNGDVYLNGDARATGAVHIVNGQLYSSLEGARDADVSLYTSETRLDADRYLDRGVVTFIRVRDPDRPHTKATFGLGPTTRIDAGKVRAGLQHGDPSLRRPHTRWRLELHTPFTQNNGGWLGFDGALVIPLADRRVELELLGYKKTVTNDDWQVSRQLNDHFISFSNNDFHDYYQRRGGSIGITVRPADFWLAEGALFAHDDLSLKLKSTGALFAGRRRLRQNPPIDDGATVGFRLRSAYDSRDNESFPRDAWYAAVKLERGVGVAGGEFVYAVVDVELNRYQRIVRGVTIDGHAKIVSAFDHAPRQTYQWLNGYGGVRGLHDIAFPVRRGDKLARFSVELRTALPDLPIVKFVLDRAYLLVFGDIGILTTSGRAAGGGVFGFLSAHSDAWKKTVGIGVSGRSFLPYLEVVVAQDVDRGNKRPRFLIRTTRLF